MNNKEKLESWATHLPVLHTVFEWCNIENVFEFGSGFGSTPFFIDKCKKVHSVEMQSEIWFEKINEKFKDCKNFFYEKSIGPTSGINILKNGDEWYDLVFVDGHGDSRWDCINNSFSKTNLIIAHDVETISYNWNLVNKPKGWSYYCYKQQNPYTGIYYKDSVNNINKVIGELNG